MNKTYPTKGSSNSYGGNYAHPNLGNEIRATGGGKGAKTPWQPKGQHTDGHGGSTKGMGPLVKGRQCDGVPKPGI